jgi:hypothetical protein
MRLAVISVSGAEGVIRVDVPAAGRLRVTGVDAGDARNVVCVGPTGHVAVGRHGGGSLRFTGLGPGEYSLGSQEVARQALNSVGDGSWGVRVDVRAGSDHEVSLAALFAGPRELGGRVVAAGIDGKDLSVRPVLRGMGTRGRHASIWPNRYAVERNGTFRIPRQQTAIERVLVSYIDESGREQVVGSGLPGQDVDVLCGSVGVTVLMADRGSGSGVRGGYSGAVNWVVGDGIRCSRKFSGVLGERLVLDCVPVGASIVVHRARGRGRILPEVVPGGTVTCRIAL